MAQKILLRPPTTASPLPQPGSFKPPSTDWLSGTWHVTHSTLPMWKTKRNVTITYTPLPPSHTTDAPITPKLEDKVTYQTLTSPALKTVNGVDTPSRGNDSGAWDWRGKGWLVIASSHWEVLGWGDLDGGGQWAVTYFANTLFTPAGVDVYSRGKEGLSEGVMGAIREALAGVPDEGVKKLAGEVFEVKRD